MAEMFDEGTTKYFEEKFLNLHKKIDAVISSLSKKEDELVGLTKSVIVLETYMKEHDKVHENLDVKSQKNKGHWLLFIFCMITAITNILVAFIK